MKYPTSTSKNRPYPKFIANEINECLEEIEFFPATVRLQVLVFGLFHHFPDEDVLNMIDTHAHKFTQYFKDNEELKEWCHKDLGFNTENRLKFFIKHELP